MTVGKRTAAFICDEPPAPNQSGPSTYNHTILQGLIDLGYAVTVICTTRRFKAVVTRAPRVEAQVRYIHARQVGDLLVCVTPQAIARAGKAMLKTLAPKRGGGASAGEGDRVARIGRFLSPRERRAVADLIPAEVDVLAVDTIFRAAPLDGWKGQARTVLVAHDVFYERSRSFAENGFKVLPMIERDAEAAIVGRFDCIVAINSSDQERLVDLAPARPCVTILPTASSKPAALDGQAERPANQIFYLGTRAHHNVDGLRWFFDTVWDQVRARRPDAVLNLVGSICEDFRDERAGVVLHGRVDDLSSVAGRCAFAINPVRMGSGLKIKMVDCFNLGLGCVTTRVGAYGFPVGEAAPFAAVDGAEAFADAVVRWIDQPDLARQAGLDAVGYARLFRQEGATSALETVLA